MDVVDVLLAQQIVESLHAGRRNGAPILGAGMGTGPPPSLKAMIRFAFSNFSAALLGGMGPTVMDAPP
jgi:hypothetical protein